MLRAQPIRPSAPTMLPKFHSVSWLQALGTADAVINMAVPQTTTRAELIDFIVSFFSAHKCAGDHLFGGFALPTNTATTTATTTTTTNAISTKGSQGGPTIILDSAFFS
jgi:hypothetical protein